MENILNIKNMVCPRCLDSVRDILKNLEINFNNIVLGEIVLSKPINKTQKQKLQLSLEERGFELLFDKNEQFTNTVKTFLVEKIHYSKHESINKLSSDLEALLNKDYSTISKTFSKLEGITIEQFVLNQKIEKIKELISYDEKTISEIADEMNYSSTAHLSNQFKKITGMSPSEYKKLNSKSRKSIDEL